MPSHKLTDAKCKAATQGKLFDGGGLFLWTSATGAKVWRLQYRLHRKQQTYTIGAYPGISLARARIAATAAREAIERGDDPAAAKKARRGGLAVSEAIAQYWAGREDVSDIYRTNATRGLEQHIAPKLGKRPIGSVTRAELMDCLSVMNAAGLYSYVRKVRRWASQVFDWAIENGHAKVNPALLIRPEKAFGRRPAEHHAALPLSEVPAFLQRLALEDKILSVYGCRLLMLTWTRTNELRGMRWGEIEGDLWRIPKERMKRRRVHLVPLSRQAVALLDELRERKTSEFVFPNDRTRERPMSENAILYLIGRMGYGGRLTGHGFRTMGSTWANENGYSADAIERQLAHAPEDPVRGAYNQAQYLPERRIILQAWANWLEQQSQPRVVSMRARQPSAG